MKAKILTKSEIKKTYIRAISAAFNIKLDEEEYTSDNLKLASKMEKFDSALVPDPSNSYHYICKTIQFADPMFHQIFMSSFEQVCFRKRVEIIDDLIKSVNTHFLLIHDKLMMYAETLSHLKSRNQLHPLEKVYHHVKKSLARKFSRYKNIDGFLNIIHKVLSHDDYDDLNDFSTWKSYWAAVDREVDLEVIRNIFDV